jgi:hypothetical protein
MLRTRIHSSNLPAPLGAVRAHFPIRKTSFKPKHLHRLEKCAAVPELMSALSELVSAVPDLASAVPELVASVPGVVSAVPVLVSAVPELVESEPLTQLLELAASFELLMDQVANSSGPLQPVISTLNGDVAALVTLTPTLPGIARLVVRFI